MTSTANRRLLAVVRQHSAIHCIVLTLGIASAVSLTGCKGDRSATERAAEEVHGKAHSHASPSETCFICDPSKRDQGRLWCTEHGRYEDRCWICQPQLRDPERPYCDEHQLYEDECFLCDPARGKDAAAGSVAHRPKPGPVSTDDPQAHGHGDPSETCIICDPSKRDPKRLWCKEHARYEDRCWECHPELRDAARPYCDEHGLYEDECFLCDPARADTRATSHRHGDTSPHAELFCNEHQVAELECGICQPQRAGLLRVGEALLIRLASERSASLAGISTSLPVREDAETSMTFFGEIHFDGSRHAKVTALSGGVLSAVHTDVGKAVNEGEVLLVIQSPEVAEARAALLSARADLRMRRSASERQQRLLADRVGSRGEMEEAEAQYQRARVAVRLARQRLLNFGVPESEVDSTREARSDLPIRSPFAGAVVARSAVLGQAVEAGDTVFEIADLSQMWVEIAVPEDHAALLGVGASIDVSVRGSGSKAVQGRVSWISPSIDRRTRMIRARGVVPNRDGRLRDGMFADVRVTVRRHPDALHVPASAVHRIDDQHFVFVESEPDLFAARRVELGDRLGSNEYVVHGGLRWEDRVVSRGSFVIKSAMFASRLGAGCTDD